MKTNTSSNKYIVIGTGKSGLGAAKLLVHKGIGVILYDENENCDTEKILSGFDEKDDIRVLKGALPEEVIKECSTAVLSPGVPVDNPLVLKLKEQGLSISGEVELAFRYGKGDVLAITGTNGKTTTTTLLGDIMKAYSLSLGGKRKVFVVGNIGEPYTLSAESMEEDSITVAEISSFQLETISTFRPVVAAVLNVTPDHLNRHYTMENYAAVKKDISRYQNEGDTLVLNYDDPITRAMAAGVKPQIVYFTRGPVPGPLKGKTDFVHIENGFICYNGRRLVSLGDIKLLGSHNHENIMAAAAMAVRYGVSDEVIRDTVAAFKAVEHRIEYVKTVDGVDYYNDSKGTNPDAAIKAIEAMVKPTVLIAGGYDKKSSYDELISAFKGRVKLMVLLGATAESIKKCAEDHGFNACVMAKDLSDAVKICHEKALKGDAVLLSPACASWDMFKSFEERGRLFKEYVRDL